MQSSNPKSCKLKFPIIATQHVNSYLTPTATSAAGIFIAPAIKSLPSNKKLPPKSRDFSRSSQLFHLTFHFQPLFYLFPQLQLQFRLPYPYIFAWNTRWSLLSDPLLSLFDYRLNLPEYFPGLYYRQDKIYLLRPMC